MSYIKQYLQKERLNAHANYASADGFIDDERHFVANEGYFGADAAPASNAGSQRSQPYIIQISNASATAVQNFDVFGYAQYFNATGWANGSLTISNCVISSGIANVTYQQLLYQSNSSPFSVGSTLIQVVSGSNGQTTQPITVNTLDANGNQALKVLTPVIDPYQQQSGTLLLSQPFRLDGLTKLTITNVLASTVVQLFLYPADNINLARGLAGNHVSRQFANPNIVRSSVAVVGGQNVAARLG
jgi:Tfp pilus assembly protein PilE